MKNFLYKLILVGLTFVLVYKLTIGDEISAILKKTNTLATKEGRKETINKIKNEIKRATEKEDYLSKEDAILINNFINKIKKELKKAENQ